MSLRNVRVALTFTNTCVLSDVVVLAKKESFPYFCTRLLAFYLTNDGVRALHVANVAEKC